VRGVAHIIYDKSSGVGGGQVTLARLTARAADGNAAAAASLPREENRQLKSVDGGSAPPTVTGLRTADCGTPPPVPTRPTLLRKPAEMYTEWQPIIRTHNIPGIPLNTCIIYC